MFHDVADPGGSVAFWEHAWRAGDFAESARFCDADPLRPLLDRHAVPGSVLLEGGCGRGAYVARHSSRGVVAVGLDFAANTLAEVRHQYPHLLLGAADIARLPLRDGAVTTYYSGGVVEHFEGGPFEAVAEARRVLAPDGVLLISVPYFSPLRRMLLPFRRSDWRRTSVHGTGRGPPGRVFFQYAYQPREFVEILAAHGFVLVGQQGYSILWGLFELPLIGRVLDLAGRSHGSGRALSTEAVPAATKGKLIKRLVVSEDDSIPVAGLIVRLLRWLAANMMMYICVPTEATHS